MKIPTQFEGYPCLDYFDSDRYTHGMWDESAQLEFIVAASQIIERPEREFLIIGRPGIDGIEFGFRRGHEGIWAYYPIDDNFKYVASSISDLVEGWYAGTIKV